MNRPQPATCQRNDNERNDNERRAIVDRALAVQARSNTVSAVEFLKAQGFDAALIERVLLEPERRRPVEH